MTTLLNWLTPSAMQSLGWALLHFLWQGTALAALAAAAMALCRRASTRYLLGVGALALMLLVPLATYFFYSQQHSAVTEIARPSALPAVTWSTAKGQTAGNIPARPSSTSALDALPWLVEAWLVGPIFQFGDSMRVQAIGSVQWDTSGHYALPEGGYPPSYPVSHAFDPSSVSTYSTLGANPANFSAPDLPPLCIAAIVLPDGSTPSFVPGYTNALYPERDTTFAPSDLGAAGVVDDLGANVGVATEHRQSGAIGRTCDPFADACVAPVPELGLLVG